jgi:hypothetical protein
MRRCVLIDAVEPEDLAVICNEFGQKPYVHAHLVISCQRTVDSAWLETNIRVPFNEISISDMESRQRAEITSGILMAVQKKLSTEQARRRLTSPAPLRNYFHRRRKGARRGPPWICELAARAPNVPCQPCVGLGCSRR